MSRAAWTLAWLAGCAAGSPPSPFDAAPAAEILEVPDVPDTPAAPPDAAPAAPPDAGPVALPPLEPQVLFEAGDSYGIYRIPALATASSGALLAFAEGRETLADDGNIDLVMRRSLDHGVTWGDRELVVDQGEDTAGNPTVIADGPRLWLAYTTNPGDDATQRAFWLTWTEDDGASWAPPRALTEVAIPGATWMATGPGRGIVTRSGRLVIPCDHRGPDGVLRSHVIVSDDAGASWVLGGSAAPDTDEATVAELSDGRLVLNMRFEGDRRARALATSVDGGATWSETTFDDRLPDPGCQGSLLRVGSAPYFANPATVEPVPRDHVTVRRSDDDGATWSAERLVDPGPSAYTALTPLTGGGVGLAWESGALFPYDRILFARLAPDALGPAESSRP